MLQKWKFGTASERLSRNGNRAAAGSLPNLSDLPKCPFYGGFSSLGAAGG